MQRIFKSLAFSVIEIQWDVFFCAPALYYRLRITHVTQRYDAFYHPALDLSLSIFLFGFYDIQPSDLDELAVVDILSWSAGKFDNSSDNII